MSCTVHHSCPPGHHHVICDKFQKELDQARDEADELRAIIIVLGRLLIQVHDLLED